MEVEKSNGKDYGYFLPFARKALKITFYATLIAFISIGPISCRGIQAADSIDFSKKFYYDEYHALLNDLDPNFPGRGLDFYNDENKDRPMAYGLILSAEANRYVHTRDVSALKMARVCGQWLIDNPDINVNGIYGFGLADEWDAFQDGSTNPENQEYTITTAIAIKGLLDWYNIETDVEKKVQIEQTVQKCLIAFTDSSANTPLGIPVYSFHPNDQKYDVFNPAFFLAGQMSRFSQIVEDQALKDTFENRSAAIIKVLLDHALKDRLGNKYWLYGLQYKRSNDLVHACFIIEGLRDYMAFSPDADVDWNLFFNHLYLFKSDNRWYEKNTKKSQTKEPNPRVWALGMLAYSLSREKKYAEIEQSLIKQLDQYRLENGRFKFKTDDDRTMVRQQAYVLLGLSHFVFH